MRLLTGFIILAMAAGVQPAAAQLEPFKDYDISDEVWSVTTIKVKANSGDHYLEGLKATWLAAMKVQKDLGHVEDYAIFSSMTPQSGDFNVILSIKYKSLDDLKPSEARYDAFIKKMGKARVDQSTERALNTYPELREITGTYLMNKISLK